jgi:hypothetical protein
MKKKVKNLQGYAMSILLTALQPNLAFSQSRAKDAASSVKAQVAAIAESTRATYRLQSQSLGQKRLQEMKLDLQQIQKNSGGGTVVDGGGGKGIVCYNEDNSIQSVELLDLFEGRVKQNYSFSHLDSLPKEQIISESLKTLQMKRLINHSYQAKDGWSVGRKDKDQELEAIQYFISDFNVALANDEGHGTTNYLNFQFLKGQKLNPTEDSFEIFYPKTCQVEQIAVYKDQKGSGSFRLYINYDLFKLMDEKNKAALILHEAIYSVLRGRSYDTNSIRTRLLISKIFANEYAGGSAPSVPINAEMDCTTPYKEIEKRFADLGQSKFTAVNLVESRNGLRVVPLYLNGVKIIDYPEGGAFIGTTIKNLQKYRDGSSSLAFSMGEIDADTTGKYVIKSNIKGKIEVIVSIDNFTNGASSFQEVLECK